MKAITRSKGRTGSLPDKHLMLQDSEHVGEDFSNQRIDMLTVVNCTFESCSFENTVFKQASFGAGDKQSVYSDCSFAGARITATAPGNARFERCDFSNVKIDQFIGVFAEFVDCTFSGDLKKCVFQARIPDADQDSTGREQNDFAGNDFSHAKFTDVGFRAGIDLSKQTLPVDSDFELILDAEAFLRETRQAFLSEKDLKLREKVFSVLRILQFGVDEGQKQLYVSSRNFPKSLREVADTLLRGAREQFGNDASR